MNNISDKTSVAQVGVVGANGYTGRELCRLLNNHPSANLSSTFTRDANWKLEDELPEMAAANITNYLINDLDQHAKQLDVIFLATPPDISMSLVAKLASDNITIIDLSGAFRLPKENFEAWYSMTHQAPQFIEQACYGLSPWWDKAALGSDVRLIANPGCYATCALMALLPLLHANILNPDSIIIDAKSGVSGAGRTAAKNLLYCELVDNFFPYKLGKHQHTPEIASSIKNLIHVDCTPLLMTHLLPLKRGISMSIYGTLAQKYQAKPALEIQTLIDHAYQQAYKDYPLIKQGGLTSDATAKNQQLIALKQVVGSARTHIGYYVYQDRIVIFASLDNLMKGAASQAIENFNITQALPVETGLATLEGLL